jgi:hypothetical protein
MLKKHPPQYNRTFKFSEITTKRIAVSRGETLTIGRNLDVNLQGERSALLRNKKVDPFGTIGATGDPLEWQAFRRKDESLTSSSSKLRKNNRVR